MSFVRGLGSYKPIVATIIIALFAIVQIIFIHNTTKRIRVEEHLLTEHLQSVSYNISNAHLWLEEFLAGDNEVDIQESWNSYEQAQDLLDETIKAENLTINLQFIKTEKKLMELVTESNKLAIKRTRLISSSGIGTDIDQQFDANFREIQNLVGELLKSAEIHMVGAEKRLHMLHLYSILLWIVIILLIPIVLYRYEVKREEAEERLEESEKSFGAMFDASLEGIILANPKTKNFYMINKAMSEMLGYSQEEAKKLGVADIHREEDLPHVVEEFEKQMRGKKNISHNIPIKKKDGTLFYADVNSAPVEIEGVGYLMGTFRDMTEHREAEKAVAESEEKFRNLFERSGDAMILLDGGETFVDCNDEALRLFGCKNRAEFLGRHPSDFSPLVQADGRSSKDVAEEKIATTFRDGKNFFEWIHYRANGEEFIADVLLMPTTIKRKRLIQGIVRDISKRKQVENTMKLIVEETPFLQGEDLFNFIVKYLAESLKAAIVFISEIRNQKTQEAHVISIWNVDKYDERFEYNIKGTPCEKVVAGQICSYPQDVSELYPQDEWLKSNKISGYLSTPLFSSSGEPLGHMGILDTKPMFNTQLNIATLQLFALRVSSEMERQQFSNEIVQAKEEAEEATKLKDKFVSLVTHDLRSPLAAMLGLLKLAERDARKVPNEDLKKTLAVTINSVDEMSNFVENLLNLSRLSTGTLTVQPKFFDAKLIGAKMVSSFGFLAEEKGIKLVNKIEIHSRIYADSALLTGAIENLVINSIKFCNSGDSILIFTPDGEKSTIAVSDTGIGIKPELLDKIFEYGLEGSRVGTAGEIGHGLGLPFAKEVVESHGGELTLETEEGKGCLFKIKLPHYRPQVLVVDDDASARFVLVEYLKSLDVDIIEAGNGEEALDYISKDLVNLIISDIEMPAVNGLELLKRLQADGKTKSIPVIIVSGKYGMEIQEEVFGLGGVDFIKKPVSLDVLIPRTRRFIG